MAGSRDGFALARLKEWRDIGAASLSYCAGSQDFADDVKALLDQITTLTAERDAAREFRKFMEKIAQGCDTEPLSAQDWLDCFDDELAALTQPASAAMEAGDE